MKKVCMLLHDFFPSDIRVSKEASSLLAADVELHLVCLQRKKEVSDELVEGIHVHRIPIAQTFFWRGIWDIILASNFFQSRFYKKMKSLHKEHKFDAFHVHDLPLSKTALDFRDNNPGTKVILDLHENYPDALKVWFAWKKNPIIRLKNKVFFSYERWFKYEKSVTQRADMVIVVVDEMKDRIVKLHDLEQDKVSVITNTEGTSFLNQKQIPDIYEKKENDFILSYTGGVGPHRGVDTCIKGMKYLKEYAGIRLEITGTLSADSEHWLRSLIKENGVEDKVSINGYQPFEKFFSYMKYADVNLIPHNRNGHTDNTIPHKLYQGMLTSNPVLVSSAPPLKRVIKECEAGLVFESGNPEDFAKQVEKLYKDSDLCKKLGTNGYQSTTKGGVNWETTGQKLAEDYSRLLN